MNGETGRSNSWRRGGRWRTAVVVAGAAVLLPPSPALSDPDRSAHQPPGMSAAKPRAVVTWNSEWMYSHLAAHGSRDGRRLVSVWQATQNGGEGRTRLESAFSRDSGRTWRRRVLTSTGFAVNPQLAVSADGRTATVVWADYRGRLLARASADGGRTWDEVRDVSQRDTYDPVLHRIAASEDGVRVVVAWAESDAELTDDGVPTQLSASASSDGGRTWSVPQSVTTDFMDGPFALLVSPDGSRSAIAWKAGYPDFSLRVASSSRRAPGWSTPVDVAKKDSRTVRSLRMGWAQRGNRLLLTWVVDEGGIVRSATSADGGRSWAPPQELFRRAGNVFLPGQPFLLRRGKKVSLALLAGRSGHESIWLTRSSDFGESFTSAERVLRLRDAAAIDARSMPLARSADGRTLITAWPAANSHQLLASRSIDGGKSWTTSLQQRRYTGEFPQLVVSRNGRAAAVVWHATTLAPTWANRIEASRLR